MNATNNNALAVIEQPYFIEKAEIPEILDWLKKAEAIKGLLEAADKWNEYAVKYAQAEARALVRLCELGGEKELRGNRRKAAVWLYEMSDAKREKMIAECADGYTLTGLYSHYVVHKDRERADTLLLEKYEAKVLQQFTDTGKVELSEFDGILEDTCLQANVKLGFKDQVRKKLRERGAHSIGDGTGYYVSEARVVHEAEDIITTKIESVMHDLLRLSRFMNNARANKPTVDLDQRFDLTNTKTLVQAMLVFAGVANAKVKNRRSARRMIADMARCLGVEDWVLPWDEGLERERVNKEEEREAVEMLAKARREAV